MSYSKSCWSIGKEVVNRSTRESVASVKRPPQALAGLVVDREEATFLEIGFSLEEDLFFSRVFFGALIVIERLSSCLAVVGGLAWFCLWLTEELEDG